MRFNSIFSVLLTTVLLALIVLAPAVSAHYSTVYHYSHAQYAGDLTVAAPVQLYSYDAFVQPLVYRYPNAANTTVVYQSAPSPYPYPYYTTYSVPVYRTDYYSAHRFPVLHAIRSLSRIEEIEYEHGRWKIEFDD